MKGKYIVFNGEDNETKEEIIQILKEHLTNKFYNVKIIDEPINPYIRRTVKKIKETQNTEDFTVQRIIELLCSADRVDSNFKIEKYKELYDVVISNSSCLNQDFYDTHRIWWAGINEDTIKPDLTIPFPNDNPDFYEYIESFICK
ncbi:hypothetical protein [Methanobrevibacter sp. DSM 116169]|uniref:hypothetical protein n=1 Tax=Methanobrevibacter sp. DSM 116169 TaxID=3242727 RepID=UPI0038FD1738